jgi:WXG100 family type VII secretion target
MSDQIQADYEKLEQIAAKFQQQSQAIAQMMQMVKASFSKLQSGGWIGQGADAFFSEMNSKVLPATQRLQNALSEADRACKDISQTVKQADEEASSPFRATQ